MQPVLADAFPVYGGLYVTGSPVVAWDTTDSAAIYSALLWLNIIVIESSLSDPCLQGVCPLPVCSLSDSISDLLR